MNFLKEDDHLEQQQSQPTYQADPLHSPPLLVNRLIKHKYLTTSLVGMWDNTLSVVLAWIYHSSDVTRITQFGLFAEDLNNNIMFPHQLQLNCFTLSICIARVGIISNLWLKDDIAVTTMSSHQSQTNVRWQCHHIKMRHMSENDVITSKSDTCQTTMSSHQSQTHVK